MTVLTNSSLRWIAFFLFQEHNWKAPVCAVVGKMPISFLHYVTETVGIKGDDVTGNVHRKGRWVKRSPVSAGRGDGRLTLGTHVL